MHTKYYYLEESLIKLVRVNHVVLVILLESHGEKLKHSPYWISFIPLCTFIPLFFLIFNSSFFLRQKMSFILLIILMNGSNKLWSLYLRNFSFSLTVGLTTITSREGNTILISLILLTSTIS